MGMIVPALVLAFAIVLGAILFVGVRRGLAMDPGCPDCGLILGQNHAHCQTCADEKNDMAAGA